jgi:hypothetical protein
MADRPEPGPIDWRWEQGHAAKAGDDARFAETGRVPRAGGNCFAVQGRTHDTKAPPKGAVNHTGRWNMTHKPLMETTRFHDLLCEGRLSRRQAHRVMASYGVGALTVSTLGNSAAASPEDQPIFFTWAGYDTPEFMQVYVEQHGEPPRYSLFGDEDEAFNKMRAGFEPDVTYPCGVSLKLWYDAGLLAPIHRHRQLHQEHGRGERDDPTHAGPARRAPEAHAAAPGIVLVPVGSKRHPASPANLVDAVVLSRCARG